jgi:hypothetical protein
MKNLVNARDDRYCPIEAFLRFNRLISLEATLEDVVAACLASPDLEVDPTRRFVRTIVPFRPDPNRDRRTLHVEGLASDETLESLQELFRGLFGKVLRVDRRMISANGGERTFSGSANIELESPEVVQRAIEAGIPYRGGRLDAVALADFKAAVRANASTEREDRGGRRPPRRGRR